MPVKDWNRPFTIFVSMTVNDMAGRRQKACDFCSGEYEHEYIDDRNGYCMWAEVYPFNNLLAVICQANDENGELIERSIEFQMNYCPVCGRKL